MLRRSLTLTATLTGFLLALVYLAFVFSAALSLPFAHHDQYRYFRDDFGPPDVRRSCANDPQYAWLYTVGRPVAAELECLAFRAVTRVSDLRVLRIVTLVVLAVGVTLLMRCLFSVTGDSHSAFLLSAAVLVLPAVQNAVFMANIPNAVAISLSLLSSILLSARRSPGPSSPHTVSPTARFAQPLLAFLVLLLALFTYPPLAYLFLLPALAMTVLAAPSTWRATRARVVRDVSFVLLASLSYFLVVRLLLQPEAASNPTHIPPPYRFQLGLDVGQKLDHLLRSVAPAALNLWSAYPNPVIALAVAAAIVSASIFTVLPISAAAGPSPDSGWPRRAGVERVLAVCVLLLLANLPSLITDVPLNLARLRLVPSAMVAVLTWWAIVAGRHRLGPMRRDHRLRTARTAALALFIVGGFLASLQTTSNVWNSHTELTYIRTRLAEHLHHPVWRIHVVRPPANGIGYNQLPTVADEFNRKSTDYHQDAPDVIRAALLEVAPSQRFATIRCDLPQEACVQHAPPGLLIITQSAYGEPIYPSSGTLIVDMNDLVRAVGNPAR